MEVVLNGTKYKPLYIPFFRSRRCEDFDVYGIRYPSGHIEYLFVFDRKNVVSELEDHLLFLIREYALEDDRHLTAKAKELKDEVRLLFGID